MQGDFRQRFPLDDLDIIGWGVPLNAIGVDLQDPEFYAVHTDLLPILAPFGIDLPECVYPTGRAIAASLLEQTDPALRQVGRTFGWLFSCTGNSLINYTDEALSEIPPLSWSAEDVAFASKLIEEAGGILRDVQVGIDHLKQSPDLLPPPTLEADERSAALVCPTGWTLPMLLALPLRLAGNGAPLIPVRDMGAAV